MARRSKRQRSLVELLEAALSGMHERPITIDAALPLVYEHLRLLSHSICRYERSEHELQPTAILHDALLDLRGAGLQIQDSAHLYRVVSQKIRRMLVDEARARRRAEHRQLRDEGDSGWLFGESYRPSESIDVLDFDQALAALEQTSQNAGMVVLLHYFGGLQSNELELILKVSDASITRQLRFAKAWMKLWIERHEGVSRVRLREPGGRRHCRRAAIKPVLVD